MPAFADALRSELEYTAWASQQLLEAAARLGPEELTRDFHTADHSVLGTLVHIFASDRVWLSRFEGEPSPGPVPPADQTLALLETDWPAVHERFQLWAAGLTDENVAAPFTWTDSKGNTWRQPLWELILHVVNHGTHHRGQVVGFLRAMGHQPPPLDLTLFFREP